MTPAACKASAGAVEHLPVARVRNLADWLGEREGGRRLDLRRRGRAPTPLHAGRPDRARSVLVLGGEGKGLRPRVAASCDALVSIPVRGRVGSLNVSAAAAVLLFEALRQRGATGSSA